MEDVRRRLGRFGVWIAPATLLAAPVSVQRAQFTRIERLGYDSLWSGEPPAGSPVGGREAFVQHGLMLAATERIVVGTGIANIGMRDAIAMHTGAATLAEAYPGRFVLGLGGERSDRLIDAILAWGDEDAVAARLRAHLEAGADHVLVHPRAGDLTSTVDDLARLAPLLNDG